MNSLSLHLLGTGLFIGVGYLLSRVWKRNDVADPLWGLGFVLVALLQAFSAGELSVRSRVLLAMILAWGLRLFLYLIRRVIQHASEDPRYAKWRQEWGDREPLWAFLQVFVLQGLMMTVIAIPITLVIRQDVQPDLGWSDFLGLSLFSIGLIFEAVADWELALFKGEPGPRGRVLSQGLWRLCRHPNYFGEILVWWGVFLVGMAVPSGVWGVVSPLLITFLLMRVSGVPMLELNMASKGPAFIAYCQSTPALWPITGQELRLFAAIFFALIAGDAFWLGGVCKDFYLAQASPIGRISNGQWEIVPWAALGVYLFLALGIRVFCVRAERPKSLALGGLFGLVTYGVFELTNLAMVRNWPSAMALVDLAWGVILCAGVSSLGSKLLSRRA